MTQKIEIQIRRGTKSELDTLMASSTPLKLGELCFTTDTFEVFCSDGTTAHQIGGLLVGDSVSNRPAAGVKGRMFLAKDTDISYIDDGTQWTNAGTPNLDSILDGTTYGRVKTTELESNQVKQVRAVTATTDITGDELHTHLTDDDIHRVINDSGDSTTDLYSAQKIHELIEASQAGLESKNSVRAGTTEALPTNTYSSGVITASADGALPVIDGVTLVVNDRLLVKNEGTAANNGIYDVTTVGDSSTPFKLTRSWDADDTPDVGEVTTGMYCFIEEGTIQENQGWILTTTGTITLGTTDLNFSQFNGAGSLTAGDGLSKTGNVFNIYVSDFAGLGLDYDTSENLRIGTQGDGLTGGNGSLLSVLHNPVGGANLAASIDVSSNGVAVKVDDVTIEGNVSNQLQIKALGVTASHLGNDIAGAGLSGGNGDPLRVADSIAGDSLIISNGVLTVVSGIGLEKTGTNNVIQITAQGDGLTGGSGSLLSVESNSVGGTNLATAVDVSSDGVAIKIDDSSINENTSNQLQIKDLGVDATKLGSDILGDGLTGANGSAIALASTVAGNGLTFTSGVLNVVAGNGFTVTSDSIDFAVDTTTGATVAPLAVSANGVGVTVDNDTILHDSGTLKVGTIDGGVL